MKDLTLEEIAEALMTVEFAINSTFDIWDQYVHYHPISMDKILAILGPHLTVLNTLVVALHDNVDKGNFIENMN
ncbi:hypothetical protein [Pelistega sp. MC2]|uniref:hypothetical protein n=1 Tax=Pelistega sp. MC2 TaxID=1720297 RepID=UPI0008DA5145|nr:hypothetical protein [Pelistega sp. MC2]